MASSKTIAGDFPPNSRDILAIFSSADLPIVFPVAMEPVNVTFFTLGWFVRAAPVLGPSPSTTLNTPSGIPASVANSAKSRAESGVSSLGFNTTVHPAASAGATFQAAIETGKFHGTIAATTPMGSLLVNAKFCLPTFCGCDRSSVSPSILVVHPA